MSNDIQTLVNVKWFKCNDHQKTISTTYMHNACKEEKPYKFNMLKVFIQNETGKKQNC